MYGGTGSGAVDTSSAPTLKDALTSEGIEVNETLWNWYTSEDIASKYSRVTPDAIADALAANSQYDVNEAPWSEVETANSSSFAEYGDAAIVVFSRSGGEGADLPSGDNGSGVEWTGTTNYLELSQEEKDMLAGLKALKDQGVFKSIVVLLNTSNSIELDFLNPEICGVDYGIDACMWIGDVGQTGANGVGWLLSGKVNPSGSIVDTFWYDNLANPAVTNFYSVPTPTMPTTATLSTRTTTTTATRASTWSTRKASTWATATPRPAMKTLSWAPATPATSTTPAWLPIPSATA